MRLGGAQASTFAPGLTIPYPALVAAGVRIQPGQTSLTVAAPGAGKSQFWANLAHRMHYPTLFWSADTDQHDATARTLAMWLGIPATEVEQKLGDETWRPWMFEKLGTRADHIDWVFDSHIEALVVGQRMDAFAEIHGKYPALVVIDNLSNVIIEPENEFAEIKTFMSLMQKLARNSKAHVAVLHHSTGKYEDGTVPIPQGGAAQNPFKTPELGLTLWRPQPTRLSVGIVKNRGGFSDPGAKHPVNLDVDFSRSLVAGYTS